jgi:TonB family protein
MSSYLGLENIPAAIPSSPDHRLRRAPRLLVELEPWGRTFRRNLLDSLLFRRPATVETTSAPAPFWPDVFVPSSLPWGAFIESVLYHGIVFAVAWGVSTVLTPRPKPVRRPVFRASDVLYYSPSEYLPPLDTGKSQRARPQKGEPEFAKQPILSVPPEADNRHQTIVTPPNIKLTQDVQTPNIVAWGNRSVPIPNAATERKPAPLPALPNQIVAPAPEVYSSARRDSSSMGQSVVAPPPELEAGKSRAMASLSADVVAPAPDASSAVGRRALNVPQASVVAPPPAINDGGARKLGDLNIGRSEVIAPAPQLAVSPQRTAPTLGGSGKAIVPPPPSLEAASGSGVGGARAAGQHGSLGQPGAPVIPPPPSVQGATSSAGSGRLIALGIHPSVAPPAEPPQGNRRGTFAATPEGKLGASGTPDIKSNSSLGTDGHGVGNGSARGNGAGTGASNGAPPGLRVEAPQRAATAAIAGGNSAGAKSGGVGDPGGTMMANASPAPTVNSPPASVSTYTRGPRVDVIDNPSPMERKVFGGRRLYSMTLNMPNLNSAGGSWVIRFAELSNSAGGGELIAPIAEHKVDPAYPLQLMRENVSGTVTLRAIIRTDGTVGEIRVVNGADQRLDHYATEALSRWHFRPAIKNGTTIDVEAIVIIPFKPILRRPF